MALTHVRALPLSVRVCETHPAGRLEFKNNLALNKQTKGMPEKSFTVEFWARGQALDTSGRTQASGRGWALSGRRGCDVTCGWEG
jgi:hypothetical protein